MARPERQTDFVVTVDGVGAFTFARRDMRDNFKIRAEYLRLTEGVPPALGLDGEPDLDDLFAQWVAAIKVLTVKSPDGWPDDPTALDPFDEDSYGKMLKVWEALQEQEKTFRRTPVGVSAEG